MIFFINLDLESGIIIGDYFLIPKFVYDQQGRFEEVEIYLKDQKANAPRYFNFFSQKNLNNLRACCNNNAIFYEYKEGDSHRIQVIQINDEGNNIGNFNRSLNGKTVDAKIEPYSFSSMLGSGKEYFTTFLEGRIYLNQITSESEIREVTNFGVLFNETISLKIKNLIGLKNSDHFVTLEKSNPFRPQKIEVYLLLNKVGSNMIKITEMYISWPISSSNRNILRLVDLGMREGVNYFFGYIEDGYGTVFKFDQKEGKIEELAEERIFVGVAKDEVFYDFGNMKFGFLVDGVDSVMRVIELNSDSVD